VSSRFGYEKAGTVGHIVIDDDEGVDVVATHGSEHAHNLYERVVTHFTGKTPVTLVDGDERHALWASIAQADKARDAALARVRELESQVEELGGIRMSTPKAFAQAEIRKQGPGEPPPAGRCMYVRAVDNEFRGCLKEHGHQDEHDFGPRYEDMLSVARSERDAAVARAEKAEAALKLRDYDHVVIARLRETAKTNAAAQRAALARAEAAERERNVLRAEQAILQARAEQAEAQLARWKDATVAESPEEAAADIERLEDVADKANDALGGLAIGASVDVVMAPVRAALDRLHDQTAGES
jgi:hypothetical protein